MQLLVVHKRSKRHAAGEIRPGQWVGTGAERLGLNNTACGQINHPSDFGAAILLLF
jgi:hypothetical protein